MMRIKLFVTNKLQCIFFSFFVIASKLDLLSDKADIMKYLFIYENDFDSKVGKSEVSYKPRGQSPNP